MLGDKPDAGQAVPADSGKLAPPVAQLVDAPPEPVVSPCAAFGALMDKHPILRPYVNRFKELGYDRIETLKHIAVDDMAAMNMVVGHRRLLQNAIQETLQKHDQQGQR